MSRYIPAFAEFYRADPLTSGYTTVLGDRSILILDGRTGKDRRHWAAQDWARKHGFDGYRLCRGHIGAPYYITASVHAVHYPKPVRVSVPVLDMPLATPEGNDERGFATPDTIGG